MALALLAAAALPLIAVASPPSSAALIGDKIKHVVVIIQENRSFDNVFHGFPGADTANSGKGHDGRTIRLKATSLLYPHDLNHAHSDFLQQYDRGKMDGFDLEHPDEELGEHEPQSTLAYSYIPRNEIQPYWDMAAQYALADRMFASNSGPSFAAHQYLIAGQSGGAVDNPSVLDNTVFAWGCDSPQNAKVATVTDYGPGHGVFPCFDYRTLGDELDAQKVSWRYYAPSFGSLGAICMKFTEEAYGLPSLGGVEARPEALIDCFDVTQQPLPFTKIATRQSASFFLDQPIEPLPPDSD